MLKVPIRCSLDTSSRAFLPLITMHNCHYFYCIREPLSSCSTGNLVKSLLNVATYSMFFCVWVYVTHFHIYFNTCRKVISDLFCCDRLCGIWMCPMYQNQELQENLRMTIRSDWELHSFADLNIPLVEFWILNKVVNFGNDGGFLLFCFCLIYG